MNANKEEDGKVTHLHEKAGAFYVYQLIDPRNNTVFYIGKGLGSRIDSHEKEAIRGIYSNKCKLIREITSTGQSILKRKIAWFEDEQAAYDFETETIKSIGLENLTNVMAGGQRAWLDRVERAKQRNDERDAKVFFVSAERLRKWLAVVDTWVGGVTIPGMRNGDKLASDLVYEIRALVAENAQRAQVVIRNGC